MNRVTVRAWLLRVLRASLNWSRYGGWRDCSHPTIVECLVVVQGQRQVWRHCEDCGTHLPSRRHQ